VAISNIFWFVGHFWLLRDSMCYFIVLMSSLLFLQRRK
jgi:hypothetical protein